MKRETLSGNPYVHGSRRGISRVSRCCAFAALWLLLVGSGPVSAVEQPEESGVGRLFGYTAGELAINESGAATYSIPISVVPGTAGMAPKPALTYSSQAGNALVGVGWSISGLSVISRCPSTVAQDGEPGGIRFDERDRFCLDGERLIAVTGSDGEDGTEYRTEQNTFRRVFSYGSAGQGPASWTVETRAGLRFEYATSDDSRIEAPGKSDVLFWNVHRIVDTLDNYLEVEYHEDPENGTYRPIEIRYTGNDRLSLEPYASVQFLYETRPDIRRRFVAGSAISVEHRLKEVRVEEDGVLFRQYLLAYETAPTGTSRLIELTECGSDASCFEPTTFQYSDAAATFESERWVGERPSSSYRWLLDMTGDGLTDYVYMKSGTRELYVRENSADTLEPGELAAGALWGTLSHSAYGDRQFFTDVDSDGLLDFVYRRAGSLELWCLRNTGSGFEPPALWGTQLNWAPNGSATWMEDINSDGYVDYLYQRRSTLEYWWKPGDGQGFGNDDYLGSAEQSVHEHWALDLDRDTRPDLLWRRGTTFYAKLSQGQSLGEQQVWGTRSYNHAASWNVDLNADGLVDHVYRRSGTWNYYFLPNTGEGFGSEQLLGNVAGGVGGSGTQNWWVDANGDGLLDLVYEKHGTRDLYVMAYDGEALATAELWGTADTLRNISYVWLTDMTGDGKPDYFFKDYYSSQEYLMDNGGAAADLLVGIREGNGKSIRFEMKPLTDPSVYRKGNAAEFPELDLQAPIHVVAGHTIDDGAGGLQSFRRHYGEGRVNLLGRGFRGFLETTVTDEISGLSTTVFYERDHRCISSKILRTEQRLGDGALIQETDNTIVVQDHGSGVSFSYVGDGTTKRYDLNGDLLSTTTTTTDYDLQGNLLSTVVDHGTSTETTIHTYDDDLELWRLGRLMRTEVTAGAQGQPDQTRTAAFAYDPGSGLLTQAVTEPDMPSLRLEKTYSHDAFGNIQTSTMLAEGYPPRTTTTLFDDRGRYPVENINALGHREHSTYELGRKVSATDANDLITTWEHDGFGRVTREIRPDSTSTATAILWCEADLCPPSAVYYVETREIGSPDSTSFFDLHDREVRQQVTGFDGTPILRDSVYDSRGRLSKVSEPYFEGETPLWTSYTYDALDRVTLEQAPGNRLTTTEYDGLTTRITNAVNQTSSRRVDSRGRLVESVDALESSTFYSYDPFGNLTQIEDPYGHLTHMTYDLRGRRILLEDPDTGITESDYDPWDRLISQTDAMEQVSTFGYDLLGRLESRSEPEGLSTWQYDQGHKGIGKLTSEIGPDGFRREFFFDVFGRPKETRTTLGGQSQSFVSSYDGLGRLDTLVYPSGFSVRTDYNAHGHPSQLRRSDGTVTYWQAQAVNARGQLERAFLGNGRHLERVYDPETGFLEQASADGIQQLAFGYDLAGNLIERSDLQRGLTEVFEYDDLQRLTSTRVIGGDEVFVSYDLLGNIRSKSDVGVYEYGADGAGPHAVTSVSGPIQQSYQYDSVGNRTTSSTGSVLYTSFNKPSRIEEGEAVLTFDYGPDRKRYRQRQYLGGSTRTISYIGELFELHEDQSHTKSLHYLRAGGEVVAVHVEETGREDRSLYLHRDHLGSVHTISDGSGQVVDVLAYDAWGRRRDGETWQLPADPDPSLLFADGFESGDTSRWQSGGTGGGGSSPEPVLARGFTGHEHLDAVGQIHMNGRVYDPVIGRFLTADPYIQAPDFSQSLNRYSYVLNNPLSLTDPSGFFFKKLFKAIGKLFKSVAKFVVKNLPAIVSLGVGLLTGGVLLPAILPALGLAAGGLVGAVLSGATVGFLTSFTGALIMGADLGTALSMGLMSAAVAGITAGLTTAVGDIFGHVTRYVGAKANAIQKALAHGVVQGISNELRGGKFKHGFFSGAFTTLTAPLVKGLFDSPFERTLAAAAVGGTASELGGGKFANGAVSGAFVQIFNEDWTPSPGPRNPYRDQAADGWNGEGPLNLELPPYKPSIRYEPQPFIPGLGDHPSHFGSPLPRGSEFDFNKLLTVGDWNLGVDLDLSPPAGVVTFQHVF